MKTLIIIYGQIRTLEISIHYIYKNIISVNRPCHVILALDSKYEDIPHSVLKLLSLYLIDIYVTQNDDTIERDMNRIEFSLVKNALLRLKKDHDYTFLLKIRTDLCIKEPIILKNIYGLCPINQFSQLWKKFSSLLSPKMNVKEKIRDYILTGGMGFFVPMQLDEENPPRSPWCITNTIEWNTGLWDRIVVENNENIIFILRGLMRDVVYVIGSTWIHFGYFQKIYDISIDFQEKYGTLLWEGHAEDELLTWYDHLERKTTLVHKKWKSITDCQFRLYHLQNNYHLIDLVNKHDYNKSFAPIQDFNKDIRDKNLFSWIIRKK